MDQSLDELLHRRLLRVPDYQRGYAWADQQLEEFWEDLSVLPDGRKHYTGTVVLRAYGEDAAVEDDAGMVYRPADIVDGQQRLTTITLLLRAIERRLRAAGEQFQADSIRNNYISIPKDGFREPVISLGTDIDVFWRRKILELDGAAPLSQLPELHAQQRLLDAKEFFATRLDELTGQADEPVRALQDLRSKLTNQLRFTLYEVDDDAQVGVIFETLNDRGKPLTELEKVKNYLMFLASGLAEGERAALTERINAAWTDIYRLLMAADITDPREEDRFLRAHWLMMHDPTRRNWDGTNSIKERYSRQQYWQQDPADVRSDIASYVSSLADAAKAFCDIRRPWRADAFTEYDDDQRRRVRQESERLRRLGALATVTPLLMAVRLRFAGDAGFYAQVAALCERFAFRVYGVLEGRADTGQGRLFRLAYEAYRREADRQQILDGVEDATIYWCPQQRLQREMAAEADERNWFQWGSIRYFLYEYEEHLTGDRRDIKKEWAEVVQAERAQTIEHVLPQTPREGEWEMFSDEDRDRLTHDLGNLALTYDNSYYSNKSFEAKRTCDDSDRDVMDAAPRCYARSPLLQEQRLANESDWTPEVVRRRHRELVRWATHRWAISGDDGPSPEQGE